MLTQHVCDTNLMLILLMKDSRVETVVGQFGRLISLVGIEEFRKISPVILTDKNQLYLT